MDLSPLSKECTHRLDLPLVEGEGTLVLLVTLTASAAVSIADLSVNVLDDPHERKEIIHRYVRANSHIQNTLSAPKMLGIEMIISTVLNSES